MHFKSKGDEYYTPSNAFEEIKDLIPKGVILDPFNNINEPKSLHSQSFLKDLGREVVDSVYNPDTDENNFMDNDGFAWDVCVSNPPFSCKKDILRKLFSLDKPFMVLLPITTICCSYYIEMTRNINCQIIVPKKRYNFNYHLDSKRNCSFDCVWICYKCELECTNGVMGGSM